MGSLAGHIIECGCQATGGLHTDWMNVPDWANIGYPVVEASADGSFVVTKPEATGGLVSTPSIAEQILYEVGDPARYILPDVICDFTQVRLTQQTPERVAVEGRARTAAHGHLQGSARPIRMDSRNCTAYNRWVRRRRQGEDEPRRRYWADQALVPAKRIGKTTPTR